MINRWTCNGFVCSDLNYAHQDHVGFFIFFLLWLSVIDVVYLLNMTFTVDFACLRAHHSLYGSVEVGRQSAVLSSIMKTLYCCYCCNCCM